MVKTEIIREKLIKLLSHLEELDNLSHYSFEEYQKNIMIRYSTERLIQLMVDLALDINNILLSSLGKQPASDYYNSFIDLIELEVLDEDFAYSIAPTTGIRNRLIHEYEKIDNRIIYENISKFISTYKKYTAKINKFIS